MKSFFNNIFMYYNIILINNNKLKIHTLNNLCNYLWIHKFFVMPLLPFLFQCSYLPYNYFDL